MNRYLGLLVLIFLMSACTSESSTGSTLQDGDTNRVEQEMTTADEQHVQSDQHQNVEPIPAKLPDPYTMENIQAAVDEYINYDMWNNPPGITNYEPYIGETFEVEVRIYDDEIYAVIEEIDDDQQFFKLLNKNNTVYIDRTLTKEEVPEGDYVSASQFDLIISKLRSPNFGKSTYKDELLAAARKYYESYCEKRQNSETVEEEWKGIVNFYIRDFYEYSTDTYAWFVFPNGDAYMAPVFFDERNGTIAAVGMKGLYVEDIYLQPEDSMYRFWFERDLEATIEVLPCVIDDENE
ncbi:hypothetical protein [Insulibacter thermoxylanivorax]|nr:hypothetical protein [Insulibacter thermoxylanivorax]